MRKTLDSLGLFGISDPRLKPQKYGLKPQKYGIKQQKYGAKPQKYGDKTTKVRNQVLQEH